MDTPQPTKEQIETAERILGAKK
jgi:hypothetical protein